jgi:hypothetical protein
MAPAVVRTPRSPDQEEHLLIDQSLAPKRTTRHHRCDDHFLDLLEEDFPTIPRVALTSALMGFPAAPKRRAISLCEWAARCDNPARALLAWARKNGRGAFAPDNGE